MDFKDSFYQRLLNRKVPSNFQNASKPSKMSWRWRDQFCKVRLASTFLLPSAHTEQQSKREKKVCVWTQDKSANSTQELSCCLGDLRRCAHKIRQQTSDKPPSPIDPLSANTIFPRKRLSDRAFLSSIIEEPVRPQHCLNASAATLALKDSPFYWHSTFAVIWSETLFELGMFPLRANSTKKHEELV